jgi:hypothetical protein
VSPRAARSAAAALLGLCGAFGPGAPRAQAADRITKVNVVRPERADAAMMEVATRAWAELSADGVVTALVDPGPALELAAGVEPSGDRSGEGDVTLTVATTCHVGETVTELALAAPGLSVRRRVVIARERTDPKLLAIRAVEVVHGMLLEADAVLERQGAPAGIVSVADVESPGEPTPAGAEPDPSPWAVGTGMLLLDSFGGLGAAYGASLQASLCRGDGVGVAVVLSGAGFGGEIPSRKGAASIEQELAVLEVTYRWGQGARLQPHVGLGVGLYHVGAQFTHGAGQAPTSDGFWAELLSAGGGATVAIVGTVRLYADARLVFAYPHPVVVTATGSTLSAADPSLLLSLGLEKAF